MLMQASLKDFFISGKLGLLYIGMLRSEVYALLGDPDDYSLLTRSQKRKGLLPAIWKYGDIELHFEGDSDSVRLIFLDNFVIPSGGTKIQLDTWEIHQHIERNDLLIQLHRHNISYQILQTSYDDKDVIRIQLQSGVQLIFAERPIPYGSPRGLNSISLAKTDEETDKTR